MKKLIAFILFCSLNSTFASAYDASDTSAPIDLEALTSIGPYPTRGSLEEARDVAELIYFQTTRTEAECQAAGSESEVGVKEMFGGEHGLLSDAEVSRVKRKTIKLAASALYAIVVQKEKYDRPRPYLTHKQIKPCIDLEGSDSYPSGHAMFGRMYARVLSAMFPEREILFLKRGEQIGINRILGGVHYPSDVAAGRQLGDILADDFLNF